jgi:hypothetical protein
VLLALVVALPAEANEMRVDQRRIRMNDLVTITVDLEGEYASLESVYVPLENLSTVGEASVSTEFAWINGEVRRRKTFRYRARPLAPGAARVGPLVLDAEGGRRDTQPAIEIEILEDRASASNDAEVILRELLASGREPLFVLGEIEKKSAYVGEAVGVTWWLYNAAVVQQWQIVSVPKLPEFWSEEQTRNEAPERAYVGDVLFQRVPIRRVVLFPLQSGRSRIGGITVEAAVMRRSSGTFGLYRGELVETTFTSAPIEIDVKSLPPGPPVDAIGELALTCQPAMQRNGGPVVLRVALTGSGNVRAVAPPRFEGEAGGTVSIEGGEVAVAREAAVFGMSRQWRYLLFPAQSGLLAIPPLSMRVFVPSSGRREELRCPTSFVNATAVAPPQSDPNREAPATTAGAPMRGRGIAWPVAAGAAVLVLTVLLAAPRLRREIAIRREAAAIVRGATPSEIRARMEARVSVDLRDPSERGDAWRALRSMLDAAERERDIAIDAEKEIERRVRALLELAKR